MNLYPNEKLDEWRSKPWKMVGCPAALQKINLAVWPGNRRKTAWKNLIYIANDVDRNLCLSQSFGLCAVLARYWLTISSRHSSCCTHLMNIISSRFINRSRLTVNHFLDTWLVCSRRRSDILVMRTLISILDSTLGMKASTVSHNGRIPYHGSLWRRLLRKMYRISIFSQLFPEQEAEDSGNQKTEWYADTQSDFRTDISISLSCCTCWWGTCVARRVCWSYS